MALRAVISVASEDAGKAILDKMARELREQGTATLPVQGDGCPNLILEITDEANSEFDPPSVSIEERPD